MMRGNGVDASGLLYDPPVAAVEILQEDNTGVGVEGLSAEDAVVTMEDKEESVEAQNQDMDITEPQMSSAESIE
ncbi:hypothetical protein ACOMHN_061873 [Nucella lapillus]